MVSGSLPIDHLRSSLGREPLVAGVPRGMIGQLLRFGIVGVVSTAAYAVLYVTFHAAIGAQAANFVALLLTAIFNTAANRAVTFGVRGSENVARHQVQGLILPKCV